MSSQQQPVSFAEKVKQAGSPGGGYPLQIDANDLDKNFTYCAVEFDEETFEIESATGLGGWPTRKIIGKGGGEPTPFFVVINGALRVANFLIDGEIEDPP